MQKSFSTADYWPKLHGKPSNNCDYPGKLFSFIFRKLNNWKKKKNQVVVKAYGYEYTGEVIDCFAKSAIAGGYGWWQRWY